MGFQNWPILCPFWLRQVNYMTSDSPWPTLNSVPSNTQLWPVIHQPVSNSVLRINFQLFLFFPPDLKLMHINPSQKQQEWMHNGNRIVRVPIPCEEQGKKGCWSKPARKVGIFRKNLIFQPGGVREFWGWRLIQRFPDTTARIIPLRLDWNVAGGDQEFVGSSAGYPMASPYLALITNFGDAKIFFYRDELDQYYDYGEKTYLNLPCVKIDRYLSQQKMR